MTIYARREEPANVYGQSETERRKNWFTAMKHYLRRKKMKESLGDRGPFKHVTPVVENPIKVVDSAATRFDQLSREDRWSRTEFNEKDAVARVTVQDPNDPDDVVLPTITANPFGPQRQISVEDGDEEVDRPGEKVSKLRFTEE